MTNVKETLLLLDSEIASANAKYEFYKAKFELLSAQDSKAMQRRALMAKIKMEEYFTYFGNLMAVKGAFRKRINTILSNYEIKEQNTFFGYYFQNKTIKELSKELNIPENVIYQRIKELEDNNLWQKRNHK